MIFDIQNLGGFSVKIKKILVLLLIIVFSAVGLLGCGQGDAPEVAVTEGEEVYEDVSEGERLLIVATTFPQYDWTRQILGSRHEDVELVLLQDTIIDLHNFQPTVSDIAMISMADLFIYIGGVSDGWVEDALRNAVNEDMIAVNLMEELEAREPDAAHCSLDDDSCHDHHHDDCDHDSHDDCDHDSHHDCDHDSHHDCDHDSHDDCDHDSHHDCDHDSHHDCDHDSHDDCDHDSHDDCDHDHHHDHHDCDHDHHHICDEHIWLSLRNAKILSTSIADALIEIDPDNGDYYMDNLVNYLGRLTALSLQYEEMIHESSVNTLLFGDRFPFRHLMNEFNIHHYAAFEGCSAETEASFSTIVFLAEKIDELGLEYILVTEASDFSIAETIRDNTASGNQEILVLDSIQSVALSDVEAGVTFLSIMESNLEVLRIALN
jgi:zinc transport system substrate-binding protein